MERCRPPVDASVNPASLADDETWHGGYYEAAMVLGHCSHSTADARLRAAIGAIWSLPYIDACVADRRIDPSQQDAVVPSTAPLSRLGQLYGWLQHDRFGGLPFTSIVVRELNRADGYDWLSVAIPLGGLGETLPEVWAYPYSDEGCQSWREPIDRCLADIALAVADRVPFLVAAIGYEICGVIDDGAFQGIFANPRRIAYVAPQTNGFHYLPANQWSW